MVPFELAARFVKAANGTRNKSGGRAGVTLVRSGASPREVDLGVQAWQMAEELRRLREHDQGLARAASLTVEATLQRSDSQGYVLSLSIRPAQDLCLQR